MIKIKARRTNLLQGMALASLVGLGSGSVIAQPAQPDAPAPPPTAAQLAAMAQGRLPTATLTAGMYNIQAELARTPQQRQTGMMGRSMMAPQAGMLFVFEAPGMQCFWMRNTPLPLSIAFLADDGTIVNVADMAPFSEVSHCSDKPVRHALEMNQGWFAKRGLKPGQRLRGGPFGG